MLGSHLINEENEARRHSFLRTCVRHVEADGAALIERYDPAFHWRGRVNASAQLGEVVCTLRTVTLEGQELGAAMEYRLRSREWKQEFRARLLDDDDLERELMAAGLKRERWLDGRRSWLLARPSAD